MENITEDKSIVLEHETSKGMKLKLSFSEDLCVWNLEFKTIGNWKSYRTYDYFTHGEKDFYMMKDR